jgi:hypothetical protein
MDFFTQNTYLKYKILYNNTRQCGLISLLPCSILLKGIARIQRADQYVTSFPELKLWLLIKYINRKTVSYPFKRRVKSHLSFASVIRIF